MPNQYTSTSNRGRNQQDDDEDDDDRQTNGQGRVKNPETDGRLKQNRDDNQGDEGNNRQQGRQAGNRQQGGAQTPAAQKKVMDRAIRVLNEIETRIHELREELEEKFGHEPGSTRGKQGGQAARGRGQQDNDEHEGGDDEVQPHGQGRVKHPESDRRLKQNRDDNNRGGDDEGDDDRQTNGQGRVKNPENDRRLKQNRDD